MTDFEKQLITTYIRSSYQTNEVVRNILDTLHQEDTGHIGDEIETNLVNTISSYMENLSHHDDKYIDNINESMNEIIPLIAEGKYNEVIDIIEHFEYDVK